MISVQVNITTAEWEFKEELPFKIESIEESTGTFDLPLYNQEGEEVDTVPLPNCKILKLKGEDDVFIVVIEEELVLNWDKENPEENKVVFDVNLAINQQLWEQGEEIGVFYVWDHLPQKLKDYKIA